MRVRFVLPLVSALLAGCSGGITQAAGDCILLARVNDANYGQSAPISADRVGPEFTRTLRQRDCEDVIVFGQPAPEPWRNGDSSFAAGTPLYASLDHPTSEVLLVGRGDGTYLELRRLPELPSPVRANRR